MASCACLPHTTPAYAFVVVQFIIIWSEGATDGTTTFGESVWARSPHEMLLFSFT